MNARQDIPPVGILMGSASDGETMQQCADTLDELGIPHEMKVCSAHRTPQRAHDYATSAADRGLKVIVCAAGMSAHLAFHGCSPAHPLAPRRPKGGSACPTS